jgi:predicted transcriptional regulator
VGIGKTSLVNKVFTSFNGFINVDLSRAESIEYVYDEFAYSCIQCLKKENLKYEDLDKQLKGSIATTDGRRFLANLFGQRAQSIYQQTNTPQRRYVLRDLTGTAIGRLNNAQKNVVVFLDESDDLNNGDINKIIQFSYFVKSQLKPPSILILSNRDFDDKFTTEYQDSRSRCSTVFNSKLELGALWVPGRGDIISILKQRFARAQPKSANFNFPLSSETRNLIDILAAGNIRDILKLTRQLLIAGASKNLKIPLDNKICKNILKEEYIEFDFGDSTDVNILEYLYQKPSSSSDLPFIQEIGIDRTRILRRLKPLTRMCLIEMEIVNKKTGKQIYKTTERYNIISNWLL